MNKLLLICVCLSGCAANGPAFHEEPQPVAPRALVYIYQPDHARAGKENADFFVSGTKVATLDPVTYTTFYLPAGQYFLKQRWPDKDLAPLGFKANLAPGTTHYFRLSAMPVPTGVGRGLTVWIYTEVSAKTALKELNGHCTFEEPFSIPFVRADAPYEKE